MPASIADSMVFQDRKLGKENALQPEKNGEKKHTQNQIILCIMVNTYTYSAQKATIHQLTTMCYPPLKMSYILQTKTRE